MFECKSEVVSRNWHGASVSPDFIQGTLAADEFDELGVEHLGIAFVCGTQMLDDVLYLVVVACEIPEHAVSSNDPARLR
jgi:hypothetical protein